MNEDPIECKICRDELTSFDDCISPCCCTGSVQHVHKSCLNAWLGTNKGSDKYLKCQDCQCEYKRHESIEQNPRIDYEMSIYAIGSTLLGSMILLFLIFAVGVSSIICIIMLLIIYFVLIIALVDNGNGFGWFYWLIIIGYLAVCWSGRKVRTFVVDIFLIIGYAAISFDFVVNRWESTKKLIKVNYLETNTMSMFDNYTKTYVTGVI